MKPTTDNRRNPVIDAVFCVDKQGLKHFAVAASSLGIHRPSSIVRGFLLSVDVTPNDVTPLFGSLRDTFGLRFELIRIPPGKFDGFPVFGHVTSGAYFRLMMGEVLPGDCEYVLYLDYDTIVHKSLEGSMSSAVSQLEESHLIVAAVAEESENTSHLRRAGAVPGPYLQSGVMLINLPKWKAKFSLQDFAKIYADFKEHIIWWDQDILNIALQNLWLQLPPTLNGTPGHRTHDTIIYHYAGNQKPWRFKANVEDKDIYEHYRQLTPVLRPPRTDPKTVFDHYTKPYRTAKKLIKKKLGIRKKKRTVA